MSKKIAVLLRDRQSEALRMSIGLTLMDDSVDVYILNRKLSRNEDTNLNIETLTDMEMNIYSNVEEGADIKFIPTEALGGRLLEYDHILPY